MAVDPDEIAQIVSASVGLYREAEQAILRLVTRYLARGIDSPTWAQQRLAEIGRLRTSLERVLGSLSRKTPDTIRRAVADAYQAGHANTLLQLASLPADVELRAAAAAAGSLPRSSTMDALAAGLVRDVGRRHSNVARDVEDIYRRVIAEAVAGSSAGGLTRRQASQLAYQRFVERGITGFTDRRGRRWRLSTYVEMGVRTVTQRAAVQGQVDRQRRLGLPFVVVSDEAQECSRCRPYEGKVLRIDYGPTGTITVPHQVTGKPVEIEVRAVLENARMAGFQHPNCRHSVRAYLPGVTRLPEQPTADPDGDRARQRQRAIERAIRRLKERELAALTPEAAAQARAKVKLWQSQMRDHLAANPQLKRLPYREQIGAGNEPDRPKPPAPAPRPAPPASPAPAASPPTPAPPMLPKRQRVTAPPPRVEDLPGLLEVDMDHQANRDMVRDVFADIIGGDYAGLTVEVKQAVEMGAGSSRSGLAIRGEIYPADSLDSNPVGVFERDFYRDRNGDLVAVHAFLQLKGEVRGRGFAGEFNGHLEQWYRQQGIVRIEVHANIDVGGYTWASQGFEFEDEESADDIIERLRFMVDIFTEVVDERREEAESATAEQARELREQARKLDAQVDEAGDILERAENSRFGDPDFPTAYEISQIGRSHDVGDGKQTWLGKAAMLGSDWHGVKWL